MDTRRHKKGPIEKGSGPHSSIYVFISIKEDRRVVAQATILVTEKSVAK